MVMHGFSVRATWLVGLALLIVLPGSTWAEDPPPEPAPIPATAMGATITCEFLGSGLIPTARVVITNTGPVRLRVPRSWTYEVIPPTALVDARTKLSKDDAYLPEQRVWLTLSERTIFGRSGQDDIIILPGRSWGHDHALDLRPGKFKPGPQFIRFCLGQQGPKSEWLRVQVPDVPNLQLVRFTTDSRKLLGEAPFKRAADAAGCVFVATAVSGDQPWTRVLTLESGDPLAAVLPSLLLDGRSVPVFADGERWRFAVRGISATGEVADDARVMAVQPLD